MERPEPVARGDGLPVLQPLHLQVGVLGGTEPGLEVGALALRGRVLGVELRLELGRPGLRGDLGRVGLL